MLKMEMIGNLGADAALRETNGSKFISFRIADTFKVTSKDTGEIMEKTTWVSCSMSAEMGAHILPFLLKGTKVFVRGVPFVNTYSSLQDGKIHAGLNLSVREIELCGSAVPNQK